MEGLKIGRPNAAEPLPIPYTRPPGPAEMAKTETANVGPGGLARPCLPANPVDGADAGREPVCAFHGTVGQGRERRAVPLRSMARIGAARLDSRDWPSPPNPSPVSQERGVN